MRINHITNCTRLQDLGAICRKGGPTKFRSVCDIAKHTLVTALSFLKLVDSSFYSNVGNAGLSIYGCAVISGGIPGAGLVDIHFAGTKRGGVCSLPQTSRSIRASNAGCQNRYEQSSEKQSSEAGLMTSEKEKPGGGMILSRLLLCCVVLLYLLW